MLSKCSSPAFARSAGIGLAVAGLCGLLASEASANCSSFTTKAASSFSTARALSSIQPAAAAAAASAVPDFKEKGNDTTITGLWQTAVLVGSTVVDQAFETFTSDGNELMIDTQPPALDNVCNGVWANVGRRKYRIKHPSWIFAADGVTLTGTAVIKTDLILNKSGNQFTGQTTIFFYDLDGNFLDQTPTFDLTGTRISVD